jgi:hypothetical protein
MILLLLMGTALLIGLWLGTTAMAVVLTMSPGFVRIVRPLVCPLGSEMVVESGADGARRPDERTIRVYCVHADGERHDVKLRALLALWVLFVLMSMPGAATVVFWGFRMIVGAG